MKKIMLLTFMGLSLALTACDDDSGGGGGFASCYMPNNGQVWNNGQNLNDPRFNNNGGGVRFEYVGQNQCWDYQTNNYADINQCHSCAGQGGQFGGPIGPNDFRDPRRGGYDPYWDRRGYDPYWDRRGGNWNYRRTGGHQVFDPYGQRGYGNRYRQRYF